MVPNNRKSKNSRLAKVIAGMTAPDLRGLTGSDMDPNIRGALMVLDIVILAFAGGMAGYYFALFERHRQYK